jgi:death-on-curing protein
VSWRWVGEAVLLAAHEQQIAEHGGALGIRDRGLLQSALARPRNKAAYADADAADLAAAYAWAIARNHPFIDGNKRAALLAAEIFLIDNGHELKADDGTTYATIMKLAEGTLSETALADWIRDHISPV